MNEIEVKAKLKNKEKVLEHLQKLGVKDLHEKKQKDISFWPNDIKETKEKLLGRNFMRIREQESNGISKIFFTLKQPQINETDHIEHEIEIKKEDIPTLKSLIETLGYYEFATLEKNRITTKIKDVGIYLDDIKGFGSYIELEKFAPADQAEKVQSELYDILESLGVDKEDYVYHGYDVLIHNAKNNL